MLYEHKKLNKILFNLLNRLCYLEKYLLNLKKLKYLQIKQKRVNSTKELVNNIKKKKDKFDHLNQFFINGFDLIRSKFNFLKYLIFL